MIFLIFWVTGRGDRSRTNVHIGVGAMAVVFITPFIVPCCFCAVEEWKWRRNLQQTQREESLELSHGCISNEVHVTSAVKTGSGMLLVETAAWRHTSI